MENYPKSGENEVTETKYSKDFYRLVEQLEALKNVAEDPNAPEEKRKMAQTYLEENSERIEQAFNTFDALDKKEQAQKIGSQSLGANKLEAEQIEQKPAGETYVDSQGFVHSASGEAQAYEPDTRWRKTQ